MRAKVKFCLMLIANGVASMDSGEQGGRRLPARSLP